MTQRNKPEPVSPPLDEPAPTSAESRAGALRAIEAARVALDDTALLPRTDAELAPALSQLAATGDDAKASGGPTVPVSKRAASLTLWRRIEAAYVTTLASDADIAGQFGVSINTLRARRWRDRTRDPESWRRDLGPRVAEAAQIMLRKADVARAMQGQSLIPSAAVLKRDTEGATAAESARILAEVDSDQTREVLVSAALQADCIMAHRSSLAKLRTLAEGMMRELLAASTLAAQSPDLDRILGDAGSAEDRKRAKSALKLALSVGSRARTLGHLSQTLAQIHEGERQALGISNTGKPPEPDRPKDWAAVATADEALDAYLSMLQRPRLAG